ncbi:YgcG family protein [Qipengyuania sp. RANM35]|uniref:TPM domain-containing protein n=1 Tax=Qipengyuania sp. RANM35 TaxID=3068635 RepID=UPI0034DB1131
MGCSQPEPEPTFPYFSEEGGRVRDMANVLSPSTEAALTAQLDRAEQQFGQQVGVVTVASLEGYPIEDFSLEYARAWKLGDAKRNDGLQILIALNERKIRIEVGKGIERTFTDIYCKEVIDMMTPYFRDGDFDAGVTVGVAELVRHMEQYPSLPANDNRPASQEKAA